MFNQDIVRTEGTMVMDLKTAEETYNGVSRNAALKSSATADAQYYLGWTYDENGKATDEAYFEEMIENTQRIDATEEMPVRYGIAVNRTTLRVFPDEKMLLDNPQDRDSDNQALSAVPVNEPMLIYHTSADGKYYQAKISSCSGWVPVADVALCADREEWLSAWDLPGEKLLLVYGNKVWTARSNETKETSERLLTMGTALELVEERTQDMRVGNRSPYHNYMVYLPVRNADGSYSKQSALIPETEKVHKGYLPLTMENIAMVSLQMLGETYGWGGMLDAEDCSGMVRSVYSCFGLNIARNGNWQWKMNMEKIDMTNMSIEEKKLILNEMPLGAALCFPGHEMIYLGRVGENYYVISAVGAIMSPDTGKRLEVRDVMINTLDVKRANGKTWLEALDKAFMPCYGKIAEKSYDFPTYQWYHDSVAYCLKNGILKNQEDGNFGLYTTVTRGMAAQALWEAAGKPEAKAECFFVDVGEAHGAREAICWVVETGIMVGYEDKTFCSESAVTGKELSEALFRYGKAMGQDLTEIFCEDCDYTEVEKVHLAEILWKFSREDVK